MFETAATEATTLSRSIEYSAIGKCYPRQRKLEVVAEKTFEFHSLAWRRRGPSTWRDVA
jgi:hypothetical protein